MIKINKSLDFDQMYQNYKKLHGSNISSPVVERNNFMYQSF